MNILFFMLLMVFRNTTLHTINDDLFDFNYKK